MKSKKKKCGLKGGIAFGLIGFFVPLITFVVAKTCTRLGSLDAGGDISRIIESETCSYVSAIITPWNLLIALVLAIVGIIIGSIFGSIIGKFVKPKKQLISDEFRPQSVLAEKVRASLIQPNYMPAKQKEPEKPEIPEESAAPVANPSQEASETKEVSASVITSDQEETPVDEKLQ